MNSSSGISIIEVVIYIGLLSLMMTSSVLILFQIVEGSARLDHAALIQEEANFMLEKIHTSLPYGATITTPLAGAHGGVLVIVSPKNPYEHTTFTRDTTSLSLRRGAHASVPLNAQEAALTNLDFNYRAATSTSSAALIITLEIDEEEFIRTINIQP